MSNEADRERLIDYLAKANDAFDSTLLKLSGGALGLSFAFVRQFVGDADARADWTLASAWILWIVSLALGLGSHYFSGLAMEEATKQQDRGETPDGGCYNQVTRCLNAAGGVTFVLGTSFAGVFMICNFGGV